MYKNFPLVLVLVVIPFLTSCQFHQEMDVRDYGAIGDGQTLNTEAIQQAIETCSQQGGGIVTIEEGVYLSGTILLKDNVTLNVAEGATLMSSLNPNDFISIDPFIDATGQYRGQCLIGAIDVENISITGKGTIDGQGEMFTPANVKKTLERLGVELVVPELPKMDSSLPYVNNKIRFSNRPFLIRLVRSDNIHISDLTLRQPAAWTLHLYQCQQFEVDSVTIYSHANRNNDGIDIDSSTDGVIRNCDIDSGDDAVCFKATSPMPTRNVLVEKCRLKSHWGAIKFGTESMGDFRDITIRDCFIHDTTGGGIKMLSVDGANIENIKIDNIEMVYTEMPLFIRLGERLLVYRDADKQPVGSINNVTISNISATTRSPEDSRLVPSTGIFITGTPNHKIGNVKLSNIAISLSGGGTTADADIVVPENETEYPEFTKLGATPAYGLFARHITQLETENITFTVENPDKRQEVILVDTD